MVQHSEELRSAFRKLLSARHGKERNLRAAKHRFESFQRPTGRTVRLFRPLLEVMIRLGNERRDEPSKRARAWLAFIAESPRHCLQLSMLADAADEGMSLTRFCDTEGMDIAFLSSRIAAFLDRVVNLFGPKQQLLHL